MTDPGTPQPAAPAAPELQFDRLEPTSDATSSATASNVEGVVCAGCGVAMLDEYYSLGGKSICARCRASVEATRATSRTPKAFGKALAFGLGAALVGAAAYFAIVVAMSGWQIGIFAIAIGWMVGRAIQKALPGGGARRYQVLAAVLTYFAMGAANLAIGIREVATDDAANTQDSTTVVAQGRQDSTVVAAPQGKVAASSDATTKAGAATPAERTRRPLLFRIGALIMFALSLPVMMISSGDILGALIVAIGVYQAWRMTGAPALAITGPFRVGGNGLAAGAS